MKRLIQLRRYRGFIPGILFVVACLELFIAYSQYRFAQRQEYVESMMFAREYINGYVYVYTTVPTKSVYQVIEIIRDAELPAIAVPSQIQTDHWLIIAPSFGEFQNMHEAKNRILGWRWTIENFWCHEARTKSDEEKTYAERLAKVRFDVFRHAQNLKEEWREDRNRCATKDFVFYGRDHHVTYYKADITTWKEYFRDLAQSEKFFVHVADNDDIKRDKAKDYTKQDFPDWFTKQKK